MSIGENIKNIRKTLGLTQKDLAKRLGVSQSMIAAYETDTRLPKRETIERIAVALDVTTNLIESGSYLIDAEDNNPFLPIFKTITPSMEFNSWDDINSYYNNPFVSGVFTVDYSLENYESEDFIFIGFLLPDNSLSPRFYKGDMAIIDITKDVIEGELIVIQNDDNATLRYYDKSINTAIIRGRVVEIRSRNLEKFADIAEWTNSELIEIEEFKKYVKSKRTTD